MNPFSIFGGAKMHNDNSQQAAQPQQQQAPATGPGQMPLQQPEGQANGTVPGQPSQAATEKKGSDSPLAEFADLWKNDNKGEKADLMEQLTLDPAKAAEAVKNANFSSAIPAETLAAIAQGGETAQQAFAQAMDTIGQQVFLKSMLAANELSKRGIGAYQQHSAEALPTQMKQYLVNHQMTTENPMLSNPALSPIVDMVKAGIAAKNPDATPQDQAAMANQFMVAMAQSLAPPQPQQPGSVGVNANVEQDWSKFF